MKPAEEIISRMALQYGPEWYKNLLERWYHLFMSEKYDEARALHDWIEDMVKKALAYMQGVEV